MRIRTVRRLLSTFMLVALLLPAPPIVEQAEAAHVVYESWNAAYRYARTGLGEPYTWGRDWWYDNDSWINNQVKDPPSKSIGSSASEGVDSSSYPAKVWAIPSYTRTNQAAGHPYTSETYYNNADFHSWRHIGWNRLTTLDGFVWRYGNKGHSGLYIRRNSDSRVVAWEAYCEDCVKWPLNGVREVIRPANFLKQKNARTFERKWWAYAGCNRCV